MNGKTKLELTWIGKEERPRLEPRILIEDAERSYCSTSPTSDDLLDNMLIKGDNLLALKSLHSTHVGRIKCVYLDPPYNTGAAFAHYDDGVEHSIWLSMMRDRLEAIRSLLRDDGSIFVQADDHEGHYLKVLMDEIFGRANFITTILWKKVDSPNDNKVAITPDHEFIFCYAKDSQSVRLKPKADAGLLGAYRTRDERGRLYRDRLLRKNGKASLRTDRPSMYFPITAPDGSTVLPIREDGQDGRWAAGRETVAALQASGELVWKNRGTEERPVWVPYTREYAPDVPTRPHFSIWSDLDTTRQTKAHHRDLYGTGNEFSTPKPENLIARILEMATEPGDIVLDSFAGSGTTGAVAHKMGRQWIMVELGEHADTHVLPRLRKVIDGEDEGGITDAAQWVGGGGFRFYRLAPSMLERDRWDNWVVSRNYNAAMLAEAMCRHMGFTYAPSQDPSDYWKHGYSTERDFIYVTTQAVTHTMLAALSHEVGPERRLLICCKAFSGKADAFDNLTIRKIPQAVLATCEWGRDDYSLQITATPEPPAAEPAGDEPETGGRTRRSTRRGRASSNGEPSLFGVTSDAVEG